MNPSRDLFAAEMRLAFFVVLAAALGLFVAAKALIARARGLPYRFGALDGGVWWNGREFPASRVLVGAGVYLLGCVAALLWALSR